MIKKIFRAFHKGAKFPSKPCKIFIDRFKINEKINVIIFFINEVCFT